MVQGIVKALAWRNPSRADLPSWAERLYQLVTTSRDCDFRLLAGSNLAIYHIVSGDIAVAQSLVEVLNSDLHSAAVSPMKKLVWLSTRSVLEWVTLDRSGSMATFEGEAPARRIPAKAHSDLPRSCLLRAFTGRARPAGGAAAKAVTLAESAVKQAQDGGNRVIWAMSCCVLVLALYEDGQIEQAQVRLEEGLAMAKGMSLLNSNMQLLAAYFALRNGDGETARRRLREGFGVAAGQGYLNFMPWRDGIMTRLCHEALAAGIEVDYVKRLASVRQLETKQSAPNPLTPKEMETLRWVKQGKTTWEIARIQEISEGTVKFHVGNILRKLDAGSRTQAVAIALEMGLLDVKR